MHYKKAILLSLKDWKLWVSSDESSDRRVMLTIKAVHALTEHYLGFGHGLVFLSNSHGGFGLQGPHGTM